MNRNVSISCIVITIVACLILSVVAIAAAIFMVNRSETTTEAVPTLAAETVPELEPSPKVEAPPEVEPTPGTDLQPPETEPTPNTDPLPPTSDGEIDPQVAQQMDLIQLQVIQDRGLKPSGEFTRVLLTREQLSQRVLDEFFVDYTPEDVKSDALILSVFGLLDPNFDLLAFYTDLLSEQIAGFYDDETLEMVVVQGEAFGGPERLTYAHEYVHALQDQNYDLDALGFNDEVCEADSERCAAVQALVEGDATLGELNWFTENASPQDANDILDFYNTFESPVYDSAPEFIREDFTFPYNYGYTFVEYLYDKGGWGTVDRAYGNPPVSTEQILHPERYPDDAPIPVDLPDFEVTLGDGWEEIDRNVMGEWYLYLILALGLDEDARLDEDEATSAAAGWGGDAYVVYHNADQGATVMVLNAVWDTASDADEFAEAFIGYADNRFGAPLSESDGETTWQGDAGYHVFYQQGDTTTWIFAPDDATAAALWEVVQQ